MVDVTVGHDLGRWPGEVQSIQRVTTKALIDTGATHVVMHPDLIARLGLTFSKRFTQRVVGGHVSDIDAFGCDITMTKQDGSRCTICDVAAIADIPPDCDILLGWDFLYAFDLQFLAGGGFALDWRGGDAVHPGKLASR